MRVICEHQRGGGLCFGSTHLVLFCMATEFRAASRVLPALLLCNAKVELTTRKGKAGWARGEDTPMTVYVHELDH